MKKASIPLEEEIFMQYSGRLIGQFPLDSNGRLPEHLKDSPYYLGFRDGFLGKKRNYGYLAGDNISYYLIAYNYGSREKHNNWIN